MQPPGIPYLPSEHHGLIGDRRTAALVAADGTMDWLCLPTFAGAPLLGCLLDSGRGGGWRLGPVHPRIGRQHYVPSTNVLVTRWASADGVLELTDAMQLRDDDEHASGTVILRRLRAVSGRHDCVGLLAACEDFGEVLQFDEDGVAHSPSAGTLRLRATHPWRHERHGPSGRFTLASGEEVWATLEAPPVRGPDPIERAPSLLDSTVADWRAWTDSLEWTGGRRDRVIRSALLAHLLTYAGCGSLVAAPTTSLPERIGGDWNADYRLSWVRDASTTIAMLAQLGDTRSARRYFDWLCTLGSSTEAPLQVVYEIDGGTRPEQHDRHELHGFRGSTPVRFGNHAFRQHQLDSLGYLANCASVYLDQGGEWQPEYWELLHRAADYTAAHWRDEGNGIWELSVRARYVSSRVMSWVVLDRALSIAERTGQRPGDGWREQAAALRNAVLTRGWSARRRAFRQREDTDALDSALSLVPMMRFLPPGDERAVSTLDAIQRDLSIDGFVYRFDPMEMPDLQTDLPMGEFEAAFLPCTFWVAAHAAMIGRRTDAESIVAAAEAVAGGPGLFAEAVDPRTRSFRGNYPLMFSQAEYLRALMELEHDPQ